MTDLAAGLARDSDIVIIGTPTSSHPAHAFQTGSRVHFTDGVPNLPDEYRNLKY